MATKQTRGKDFELQVTLDASQITDRKGDHPVQVVVEDSRGKLRSARAIVDAKGGGAATFKFEEHPGSLRVLVGPHDATPEEMTRLQTVNVDVPSRHWRDEGVLKLPPIIIPPYYWHWWLVWCREFVISGIVVCPDGKPVPGAKVCAYDVDWFLYWTSFQEIGCATTDMSGAFTLRFKWCCGWWPWWWWLNHYWHLDPILIDRVVPVLQRDPDIIGLKPKAQPALADLRNFLGADAVHIGGAELNPTTIAALREPLLQRLPPAPELERLRIWPWYPWLPWFDCTPDVIFKVTQDCNENDTVIVNETIFDTRWNIDTTLNDVILHANEQACCAPPHHTCPGGPNCLDFTMVCNHTINTIGGNTGALPTPVGYQNPQGADYLSDRPYTGRIAIFGTIDCLEQVDYYEFEWSLAGANVWHPMPPAANGAFSRSYLQFLPTPSFHAVPFSTSLISGHNLYETLKHYEDHHPPNDWGFNRYWIGNSRDQLINWLTDGNFNDGTYDLRIRGWRMVGGMLDDVGILKVCGSENDSTLTLCVDNRVIGADPHGNPCGSGTIHVCTDEPDTAIISIKILKAGEPPIEIEPCGTFEVSAADTVAIDFVAYDPDGHLAQYDLSARYGVNQSRALLPLAPTLIPRPAAWGGVPPAQQVGWDYAQAVDPAQGAIRPTWRGGTLHLEMPATGPNGAFPITCCYVLRLEASKRNIPNCDGPPVLLRNWSETSFTITVV